MISGRGHDLISDEAVVIRRGALLRAVSLRSKGGSLPLSRSVSESYELGLLIYEHYEKYLKAIKEAVEQEAEHSGFEVKDFQAGSQTMMRFRFAPGLIIDFPVFELRLGGLRLVGRACLTVCFNDSVSKVWCRFIVGPAAKDDEALNLDIGDRRLIAAASLCERVNDCVSQAYLDDFQTLAGTKSTRDKVQFQKVGELNYIGIEEDPEVVARLVDRLDHLEEEKDDSLLVLKQRLEALTNVIESADGEASSTELPGPPFRTFSGREGSPAVFTSLVKGGTATFAVASARSKPLSPEMQAKLGRKSNNSALDVTAQLATLMASEF